MTRYGIATLFGDYKVGYEFKPDNIPLHLTHVDSFEVDLNVDQLATRLHQVLRHHQEFRVQAMADAFMGPDKDIPVTMLALTPELRDLHQAIMDILESEGATLKSPHFHRDGYGPHVSIYGTRRVPLGENVLVKDISVGVKVGDGPSAIHRIVATIPLGHL